MSDLMAIALLLIPISIFSWIAVHYFIHADRSSQSDSTSMVVVKQPERQLIPPPPPLPMQLQARIDKLNAELATAIDLREKIIDFQVDNDDIYIARVVRNTRNLDAYKDNPELYAKLKKRFERTEQRLEQDLDDLDEATTETLGTTAQIPYYSDQIPEDIVQLVRLIELERQRMLSDKDGRR